MRNWLSKATGAFQREAVEVPQPFQISCECGQRHTGLRRARFQNIICKSCGASLFILPRDVYPAPPEPVVRESPKIPLRVSEDAETEDELTVRSPSEQPPKKLFQPQGPGPLPKPRPTRRQKRKQEEQAARQREQAALPPPRGPSIFFRLGNWSAQLLWHTWSGFVGFWTPLRSLFAGLAVALVLATGLMVAQVRTTQAEQLVRQHGASGMKAVEDAEWATAAKDLQLAVVGLDRLRRDDPEAQEMRQYYRETNALFSLSDVTLFELIAAARPEIAKPDKLTWENSFRSRFLGKWMVFEGEVKQTAPRAKDQPARFELQIPWVPGAPGERAVIQADFPVLESLLKEGPATVIFAGQLAACARQDDAWRIELNPQTGFLWSHLETYRKLGLGQDPLHPEAELTARLAAQARVNGEVRE